MGPKGRSPPLLRSELEDVAFACLEGCGFCCTFQPEVTTRELALLRARFKPKPVAVSVGGDRQYLQLQNKCGACTLLERRGCTAYDLRPQHCRYFPFHLHFADEPEAYVNYTCRGVERREGGDLHAPFERNVLGNATPEEIARHSALARETYGAFERKARRANVWGSVEAVVQEALAAGPAVFGATWLARASKRGGEDLTPDDLLEEAFEPFEAETVTRRPFYLAPDLKWITFSRASEDALAVLEMDEAGQLLPLARVDGLYPWQDLPAPVAEGLLPYLLRLTRRRLFAGSVYAIVDDSRYKTSVEEATWWRLVEIVSDLALRARVLLAMGVPQDRVADETARFYDSAFLDSETIGGFL